MKILLTAFEAFGGEDINPSYEVLKRIGDSFDGVNIIKLKVPTAFYASVEVTVEKIKETHPDVVLSIGQAGGRTEITVERFAVNIDDTSVPDNLGQKPDSKLINVEGDTAYFATIPVKSIVNAMKELGIPASISNSAGTFVCNHLMYGVLNYIHKNNLEIKAGFIHVPYLEEQVLGKPDTPSMPLETMIRAIETAIKVIVSKND